MKNRNGFAAIDLLTRIREFYEKDGRMNEQDLRIYAEALKGIIYGLCNEVPEAFEFVEEKIFTLEEARKIEKNEKLLSL